MRTREALRRVVQVTDDGVMITQARPLDEPGPAIAYVNPAFERLTGYAAEEAVGRSPRFLQGPETDPETRRRVRQALEQQVPVRVEIVNYRRDGTPFWIDLAIHPIRNGAGACENFLGILHDITDRKRAQQALTQSEARFRAVAELLPMGVAVTREADGLILYGNPWLASFYGTDSAGLLGRSITEIYGDPRDRERLRARLREVEVVGDVEIEGHRPDGTSATALISARRITYDGEPAILVVGTDISGRKRLERRLRDAERQARAATQAVEAASLARTKFFAAASHDLRQPYQAMHLLLPLLVKQLTTPEQREIAHRLGEAMAAGEGLLSALLDVSALEAGAVHPRPVNFSIRDFLERLGREFAEQARVVGLKFRVFACDAWVRSDPVLLQRIVSNLLSNAVRYTPSGGILLGCRRRGERVRIEVWDTGVGIPEEQLGDVFEDFVQLGASPGIGGRGLGLGLSVVARTARLLDHRFDLRSAPGRGSVFAVELPEVASAAGGGNPAQESVAEPEALAARPVFVVDDDPIILDGLSRVLRSWGMQVLAARSLDHLAGQMARVRTPPHLILTDYGLPAGATAMDAIDLIRAHYRRNDIPAVVLTAETDSERLRNSVGDEYVVLRKPVDTETLRTVVQQAISGA